MPTHSYEQLSFSQYIENTQNSHLTSASKPKNKTLTKPKKPEMPEILKKCDRTNAKTFLNTLGKDGFYCNYNAYFFEGERNVSLVDVYDITQEDERLLIYTQPSVRSSEFLTDGYIQYVRFWGDYLEIPAVYFGEDGTMWSSNIHINLVDRCYRNDHRKTCNTILRFSASEWKIETKMLFRPCFIQTEEELGELVKRINPYAYEFCKTNSCEFASFLMNPQLETLHKAGFAFARKFFVSRESASHHRESKVDIDCFNRLCKHGKSPKEIFKTSKAVYTTLKREYSLSIWDSMRKLDKFGRLNQDTIQQVYDMGFSGDDLKNLNEILNKTYEGKPVFTFTTLVNYLNRLDMYEAINRKEAFMLLRDYLTMCNQINQKPKIDGDSLKREHDVTARTVRQHRDEIMAREIQSSCDKLQKYNYQEPVYFIRGVENYDDLIDEAKQQHNCVASYAHSIKTGRSLIYVMREVATPTKSLITVELSPGEKNIRQKFLAYNQPLRNKSQSEFLERWLKHVRAVDTGLAPVQELNLNAPQQAAPMLPNEIAGAGFTQTM